ncbi:MAG: bifunctional diaminohydroxyphosphoribosylaminopyrimidine deaminase/5-amino-6-(5-phosphoribosylamino)uracil reductase RibD [Bacteroidetes bacterium]|nr:bifunctional diaminohydroxyphosphoribosylaminopyrimidine deaminase/5-amino-6-(5-phosphoribosylamino)uracil reductase RibD [Bacteroidota bacterium]
MEEEQKYIRRAISLAKRGLGWVNPNPMVGAVIVRNGRIIGEGYHEFFGGPHAEVNAILHAQESVRGATLYVTLEPCSHEGKTAPCTDLIISKGIRKVVIGMKDPNPLVNGNGIQILTDAGIEVSTGIEQALVCKMNEVFIKYIVTGKPFCTLKTAMTLDGKIATVENASRWISCGESRRYVHELRQQYSAVMVGVNTILYDDPLLNTRRARKKSKDPLKVIVDSSGKIPSGSQVLKMNPQLTIIATTGKMEIPKIRELERMGAQVLVCPQKDEKVDLGYLMVSLGKMGVDSVLLEGGSTIAFSALAEGIVDKVISFVAPKIIGGAGAPSPVGGRGLSSMEDAIGLEEFHFRKIGSDLLIEGYIRSDNRKMENGE